MRSDVNILSFISILPSTQGESTSRNSSDYRRHFDKIILTNRSEIIQMGACVSRHDKARTDAKNNLGLVPPDKISPALRLV